MLGLYKYSEHFGSQGMLEGLFFATAQDMQSMMNKEIYFGEVLGKHSEVETIIKKDSVTLITDDAEEVQRLQKLGIQVGIDLTDYLDQVE